MTRGIGVRYFRSVLWASTLTVVAVAILNAMLVLEANIRDAAAKFSFDAEQIATRVEDWLGVVSQRVVESATEARLRQNKREIDDDLRRWLRQESSVSEIALRDSRGVWVSALNREQIVQRVGESGTSSFSDWRTLRMANALPVQLRAALSSGAGTPVALLSVKDGSSQPIEVQALISKSYLDRLARSLNSSPVGVVLLLNEKNEVLASSRATSVDAAEQYELGAPWTAIAGYLSNRGLLLLRDRNGALWIASERTIPSVPWKLHFRAPVATLASNLGAVLSWNLIILAIGLLVSLLLALRFARNLSQPVIALHKILAKAKLASTNPRTAAIDELEHLLKMAPEIERELQATYADMEQRVEEKTLELRDLNTTLESRVAEKMKEVARLSRLTRFVPSSVANRIVSGDAEDPLQSRQRDVAVVFVDIRGFTAFSQRSEAAVVMSVLQKFHAALGECINRFSATVERFTGDAVMVFFNDPEPIESPCRTAVSFAIEVCDAMLNLMAELSLQQIDLGVGIGVAFGPATVGAVGYAQRVDYGAIGPVTNLAARLCALADAGEIVVEKQTWIESSLTIETSAERTVVAKGFDNPIPVVSLVQSRK